MDAGAVTTLIAAFIAAGMSGVALYASKVQGDKQSELQKTLTKQTTDLQERLTRETEQLTERISRDEANAESKRYFSVIWDKMTTLSYINPDKPIAVDVRQAQNVLDFAALCWLNNIVDKQMVMLGFGQTYDEIYTQIHQITQPIEGIGMTGPQLLNRSPAIGAAYAEMRDHANKKVSLSTKEGNQ